MEILGAATKPNKHKENIFFKKLLKIDNSVSLDEAGS